MLYWFARLILETDWNGAMAYKSGMRAEEFRHVNRYNYNRRYWKLRESGLSSYEARAKMDGTTPAVIKMRSNRSNRRQAERLGGYPKVGTSAYNRWLVAR
jgi:hypothetical protein